MPEVSREVVKNIKGIKIIGVKTINEALQVYELKRCDC